MGAARNIPGLRTIFGIDHRSERIFCRKHHKFRHRSYDNDNRYCAGDFRPDIRIPLSAYGVVAFRFVEKKPRKTVAQKHRSGTFAISQMQGVLRDVATRNFCYRYHSCYSAILGALLLPFFGLRRPAIFIIQKLTLVSRWGISASGLVSISDNGFADQAGQRRVEPGGIWE